jgi:hypothetical protein
LGSGLCWPQVSRETDSKRSLPGAGEAERGTSGAPLCHAGVLDLGRAPDLSTFVLAGERNNRGYIHSNGKLNIPVGQLACIGTGGFSYAPGAKY